VAAACVEELFLELAELLPEFVVLIALIPESPVEIAISLITPF
jgi:hypothetical protein